jgi:cytochrome c oxidase subunit II
MRFTIAMLILALAACSSQKPAAPPSQSPTGDSYANGRTIFTTGRDLQGHRITASPAPLKSSCIQCHRANGAGGVHFADGAVSADLRHKALTTEQKHPYTIALLERAISTGVDNEGEKLDPVMPRWKMSQQDLHDVAQYVFDRLK